MEGELRILIVEDVPADAELAEWELRKGGIGFSAVRVDTEEAFLRELESFRPDLVITDYAMPEFDGLRALGLSLARDPELPVIVLTGSMNEETAVACMKAGAADYVIKEQVGRLSRAVLGAIESRRVRREKAESEAELEAIYENAPLMMVLLDAEARIHKANGYTAAFAGQPVVGMHLGRALRCVHAPAIPESYGFAPACGACEIRRGVTETLETGQSHRNLEAVLACGPGAGDGGGKMAFLLSTSRVRIGEKPYVLATLLDISERRRARERERQSREEAERLAGELAMIAEIGRVAGSTLEIDQLFARLAEESRRLIPFDRFAVNLCNDDRQSLRIRYACGLELEDRRPGAVLPLAGTLSGEVLRARSGQLLRSENREEMLRDFPGVGHSLRAGLLSLIAVPFLYRDEPIGVLFFQSKTADQYGERDLALAERIGLQVASAIAHAGLFGELDLAKARERRSREEAERLAGEIGIIAEIGRLAGSTLELDQVFAQLAAGVRRLVPFDRFVVNLCNRDRESFRIQYVCGLEIDDRRQGDVVPLSGTVPEEVMRLRRGVLLRLEDADGLPQRFPGAENAFRSGLRSMIAVPLLYRDEVIGVMTFRSKDRGAYAERDLALAERIALQVASAIAHAELFGELDLAKERERRSREEAERLAGELGMIAEIGRVAGSTLDLDRLFEQLAAGVRRLVPFDRLAVNLCNRDRESFRIRYVCGLELEERQPGATVPLAGTLSGEVLRLRSGLRLHSGNVDELRHFPGIAFSLRAGFRSLIAVPLVYRDEAIGVLVYQTRAADQYGERDLALAERIGLQVASAIANAELFGELDLAKERERQSREEAERLAGELGVIAEIGRVAGSTLELDRVYGRLADEVRKLVPFDRFAVNLCDRDQGILRIQYACGLELEDRRPGDVVPLAGTLSQEVLRMGGGMVLGSDSRDELLRRFPGVGSAVRAGLQSLMVVPLLYRDAAIGVLSFRARNPDAYTERDLQLAERIGLQVAGAIAHAELFGELRLAEESLRESERLLSTLMDNLPGMAYRCRLDEEWTMLFVSDGSLPLTGYRSAELVGNGLVSYGRLIHEDDRLRVWQEVERAVADGRPFTLEYRIVDAAGATKWVWEKGCAVAGPDGGVQWLEGFISDISERRRVGEQLRQTLESLRRSVSTTIQVMVAAVETRDPYTAGHQVRTADLARAIAGEMGLPQPQVDGLRMAGSIHDIGKLAVPAEILSKPTKLSPIELRLIQEHSRRGHEMLRDVESPWPLAEIVLQHHERLDGSGYPQSLRGDEILIEARILAVADVVEAMASHRPYRASRGIDEALCEIETHSGTLYDPAVVAACARLFREKGFTLNGG